jgi:hypothetical protein
MRGSTMAKPIDIAREMARHFEAGKSVEETITAVRKAFPLATSAELQEACEVGRDRVEHWQEAISEDVQKLFQMIARCEPEAKIQAAFRRAKRKADALKARS